MMRNKNEAGKKGLTLSVRHNKVLIGPQDISYDAYYQ